MICNPTVHGKIHASLIANIKKYNITKNDTIPASESFSFQNTGRWSGVAPKKYGIYKNDIQLQLGPTVTW